MNQDSRRSLPAFIVLSPEDVAARACELYPSGARLMGLTVIIGFALNRNCARGERRLVPAAIDNPRPLLPAAFQSDHRTAFA